MDQKPEIQYVGQFYVYGSEVQAEKKKQQKKNQLPKIPKPTREHYIYIDPAAVCGIAVAAVMLVVLIVGAFQLRGAMNEYNRQSEVLSSVRRENARLEHQYRTGLDIDAVRDRAESLGMVEAAEAEHTSLRVTVPERAKEESLWDRVMWHLKGLLYGVDESKADEIFEKDVLSNIGSGENID